MILMHDPICQQSKLINHQYQQQQQHVLSSQVLDESPGAVLAPRVAVRPQRGGRAHVEIPPLLTPSSVGDGVEVEPCSLLVIPHDGVDGRLDIVPDVPEMAGSGY